jgi:methylmalonyl-CoA mutase
LTDEIARKAWDLFQELEKQGGMAACLQKGLVQDQCVESAKQRSTRLATRKDVLVGTNMYANPGESYLDPDENDYISLKAERSGYLARYRQGRDESAATNAIERLSRSMSDGALQLVEPAIEAARCGATLGEIEQALRREGDSGAEISSLGLFRPAVLFERLRISTEVFIKQAGYHPQVFLVNMGPIPQHKARADFSSGFFEVGGFEVLKNQGFLAVEKAIEAAVSTAAMIFVICSTDETYPELVPVLTKRIKAFRPDSVVVVAGYPKEHIETFREVGVDEFIHLRANQYDILQKLMKRLGILDSQPWTRHIE